MSRKIIGITVGTPIKPERIAEKLPPIDSIHKGDTPPTDETYQYWLDTSVAPALLKYKNDNGYWVGIAGGGGTSDVDYITDEEYESIMGGLGI
jgi:hypothetical protein